MRQTMLSDHHLIRFAAPMALHKGETRYNYKAKWDPFFTDSKKPTTFPEYVNYAWVDRESDDDVRSLQKGLSDNCPKTT